MRVRLVVCCVCARTAYVCAYVSHIIYVIDMLHSATYTYLPPPAETAARTRRDVDEVRVRLALRADQRQLHPSTPRVLPEYSPSTPSLLPEHSLTTPSLLPEYP